MSFKWAANGNMRVIMVQYKIATSFWVKGVAGKHRLQCAINIEWKYTLRKFQTAIKSNGKQCRGYQVKERNGKRNVEKKTYLLTGTASRLPTTIQLIINAIIADLTTISH